MKKAKLTEKTKYSYVIQKNNVNRSFDLESEIKQIEYIFGFKLNINFVDNIKYGCIEDEKDGLIRVSIHQPRSNVILTIIHEALHQVGFDHDKKMRKLGYFSVSKFRGKKYRDTFTERVANVVLRKPCRWR